ncbi:MAG TPA: M50 family metallopeptidase [Anaerolineales bacterium]|nr:M50 family metallopeptidase [Anaerolineales bacterium]
MFDLEYFVATYLTDIRNFLIFVLIVGGLIFLHELGHFLAAVRLGVKVKEFGLGFPPRLVGTALDKTGRRRWFFGKAPHDLDPNSVIYSFNWLPLGGFVRPAGEDDPAVPDGLAASPKLTRFIVLAAGPAMNLLVGVIVFAVAFATGWPAGHVRIAGLVADAPAERAGVQVGDIVTTANGKVVTDQNGRLTDEIYANLGQPVTIQLERDGEPVAITLVPRTEWPSDQGPAGLILDYEWTLVTQPWPQAFVSGVGQVGYQIRETVMLPANLIAGRLQASDARPVSIVGMAQINNAVVDTAYEIKSIFPILQFAGIITVALALTNLLPLPALDGGRILFVLIEAVRRRRVDPLREGYVHVIGMLVLLALMVVMVINDIVNPIEFR